MLACDNRGNFFLWLRFCTKNGFSQHRAEEIVLVIDGETEMQIGEKFYTASTGGFYYLGSNVLHAIKTTGTKPATYFAIQFE